jgi:uncharacterized Rmd1/YagE family protein
MDVISYFQDTPLEMKLVKDRLQHRIFNYEPDEVSYHLGEGYFHLTQYGSLVFMGVPATERNAIIEELQGFISGEGAWKKMDSMDVVVDASAEYEVEFDHITLPLLDQRIAEIIMIEMAESAALHFYKKETEELLERTRGFTKRLERSGHIGMSGKRLRTFIGSSLNLKGKIMENLYLFDTPKSAWKDEFLNQLDKDLNKELEIHQRYRAIEDKLDIITENLSLFKDLMQHRHSSFLEWIIIILILIEVVHIFVK